MTLGPEIFSRGLYRFLRRTKSALSPMSSRSQRSQTQVCLGIPRAGAARPPFPAFCA